MKIKHRYNFLTLLLVTSSLAVAAQDSVTYSTTVRTVNKSDFYKISLNPEIVGRASKNMDDIRILDKDGKQVPYLLRTDTPVFTENNFLELSVISVRKEADKLTHVVIRNLPGKDVSELLLVVKNNDASRTVTLSGSDDQNQWYVIKENIPLTNVAPGATDRFVQSLEFPKSNYRYFKVIINGKDLLPVNIVKVGFYEDVLKTGKYVSNPSPTVVQKDSGRISYVRIHFARAYRTDQITFDISGPKYYQRVLKMYEIENAARTAEYDFQVRSGQPSGFNTSIKASDLEIEISNDDNPPLKINAVKSLQLSNYLYAYLDSAHEYKLTFGDHKLEAPTYDLAYFRDSLKNANSVLETGDIKTVKTTQATKPASSMLSTVLMWVIIAAVLALLLFLTMRMAKEVNNKKDTGGKA